MSNNPSNPLTQASCHTARSETSASVSANGTTKPNDASPLESEDLEEGHSSNSTPAVHFAWAKEGGQNGDEDFSDSSAGATSVATTFFRLRNDAEEGIEPLYGNGAVKSTVYMNGAIFRSQELATRSADRVVANSTSSTIDCSICFSKLAEDADFASFLARYPGLRNSHEIHNISTNGIARRYHHLLDLTNPLKVSVIVLEDGQGGVTHWWHAYSTPAPLTFEEHVGYIERLHTDVHATLQSLRAAIRRFNLDVTMTPEISEVSNAMQEWWSEQIILASTNSEVQEGPSTPAASVLDQDGEVSLTLGLPPTLVSKNEGRISVASLTEGRSVGYVVACLSILASNSVAINGMAHCEGVSG